MNKILIADPNSITRKALALLLRHRFDYLNIIEVEALPALSSQLEEHAPDILLLDEAILRNLSNEDKLHLKDNPHLKVAIFSIQREDAYQAQDLRATFIHKGSNGEQVLEQIQHFLQEGTNERA